MQHADRGDFGPIPLYTSGATVVGGTARRRIVLVAAVVIWAISGLMLLVAVLSGAWILLPLALPIAYGAKTDPWETYVLLRDTPRVEGPGSLEVRDGRLLVVHPCLSQSLSVPVDEIAAVVVDDGANSGSVRAERFPIHKPRGSVHPIGEEDFAVRCEVAGDDDSVVDLDSLTAPWPNVLVMLRVPVSFTVLAPPRMSASRGGNFSMHYRPFARTWQEVQPIAFTVTVKDVDALRRVLSDRSFRGGLNCHDLVRLRPHPHPLLDRIPADFEG